MTRTQEMTEIAERAGRHFNGTDGFKNAGRINAYVCDGGSLGAQHCGHFVITIDREPGVTPFMTKCENCGQWAYSKGYRVQEGLVPSHEWYRPDDLAQVDEGSRDHVKNGGLLLRRIAKDARPAHSPMPGHLLPIAERVGPQLRQIADQVFADAMEAGKHRPEAERYNDALSMMAQAAAYVGLQFWQQAFLRHTDKPPQAVLNVVIEDIGLRIAWGVQQGLDMYAAQMAAKNGGLN